MDVQQMIESTRDALTVRRVFGDPVDRDGLTVIPVARVRGAAGGGDGEGPNGTGSGGGSAMIAQPVGMYVIRGSSVRWVPALDVNRIVLGGQVVAIVVLLVVRGLSRTRRRSR